MKKLLLILLCVPLMFSFGDNNDNDEKVQKEEIEDVQETELINILININRQEIE